MPDEIYWETLFDVELILDRLGIDSAVNDVAELGCGYGTFTLPVARRICGAIHTFDIDASMVARTAQRAQAAALGNVKCQIWDVMERGFQVPQEVDATLLFNILHCEQPERLLRHAVDVTEAGGRVLVIHWRHDSSTPRGPSLDIRPRPEQIALMAQGLSDLELRGEVIDLPPWHYGLVLHRR